LQPGGIASRGREETSPAFAEAPARARFAFAPIDVATNRGDRTVEGLATPPGRPAGVTPFRHTCATILFRAGWNAVQVQRWHGHHKPSFTLVTYVRLLDEDVPEPLVFGGLSGGGHHSGDQLGDTEPTKPAETASGAEAEIAPFPAKKPPSARPGETPHDNS
jgi:hypothetical protein